MKGASKFGRPSARTSLPEMQGLIQGRKCGSVKDFGYTSSRTSVVEDVGCRQRKKMIQPLADLT